MRVGVIWSDSTDPDFLYITLMYAADRVFYLGVPSWNTNYIPHTDALDVDYFFNNFVDVYTDIFEE